MKKFGISLLFVAVVMVFIVTAQELPKCPKCQQPVYSSWWKYCPACSTKLPEFEIKGKSIDEEIVLGNVYKNTKWKFSIDKPSDNWSFLTGKEAADFNKDAILAMSTESAYGMVIVEEMPDIQLKEYEKLVLPKLDNRQVASRKMIQIGGVQGVVDEVEGAYEGAQIMWKIAIYNEGDFYYQVHCWASKSLFERYRKECDIIIESFKYYTEK
ncbi:MAG: hypothetical protein A2Y62_05395 [Candidatus Fischerbacteria bacterium RBG_13_37_8]|uniref:Uncharacterized protein n=1 Tax=Candidatus Fischerbacteria bacterium RBG_13_37_8 TaxID=1817863 RepID=A0A1F5VXJ5_9BACT|nr:MAG: hypothetical protein A2Y62_05395 [Candidatus Fischerbacteria bacterium RBG_13_37_8]